MGGSGGTVNRIFTLVRVCEVVAAAFVWISNIWRDRNSRASLPCCKYTYSDLHCNPPCVPRCLLLMRVTVCAVLRQTRHNKGIYARTSNFLFAIRCHICLHSACRKVEADARKYVYTPFDHLININSTKFVHCCFYYIHIQEHTIKSKIYIYTIKINTNM